MRCFGIFGAVDYIAKMKLGEVDVQCERAIVVGGGNTAIDAVRELPKSVFQT